MAGGMADTSAQVIVTGAKFGDTALLYVNKFGLMPLRLYSKFNLRRLSKAVNGTVVPWITTPTAEELGYCDQVLLMSWETRVSPYSAPKKSRLLQLSSEVPRITT